MIFAIIRGPLGFAVDRVCSLSRDAIKLYAEVNWPGYLGITWISQGSQNDHYDFKMLPVVAGVHRLS